jgi:hypothetical protein
VLYSEFRWNKRTVSSILEGAALDSTSTLLDASVEEIASLEMPSEQLDYDAVAAYTVSTIDDA